MVGLQVVVLGAPTSLASIMMIGPHHAAVMHVGDSSEVGQREQHMGGSQGLTRKCWSEFLCLGDYLAPPRHASPPPPPRGMRSVDAPPPPPAPAAGAPPAGGPVAGAQLGIFTCWPAQGAFRFLMGLPSPPPGAAGDFLLALVLRR
jgi:hypothetical protein